VHAQGARGNAVWGGLVFATNEPGRTSGQYDLHPYAKRLREVFGYRFYDLLGSDRQPIRPGGVQQLALGKEFNVGLRFIERRGNSAAFRMQLFRGARLIVESTVLLGRDQPFVIRGPQWGSGQILILLMVR